MGYNTPAIIRYPFDSISFYNPNATLLRLNSDYPLGPRETAARTVPFPEPIPQVLDKLG